MGAVVAHKNYPHYPPPFQVTGEVVDLIINSRQFKIRSMTANGSTSLFHEAHLLAFCEQQFSEKNPLGVCLVLILSALSLIRPYQPLAVA
jgi:hypothetical protein